MGKNFVSNDNATSLMTAIAGKVNELNGNTGIAEGESFALPYTYDGNALATHIYGMSIQDGTPDPSNPVDIVSSKADFRCVGKNLIPYPYDAGSYTSRGITFTPNEDGRILVDGTNDNTGNSTFIYKTFTLVKGSYALSGCPSQPASGNTYRWGLVKVSDDSTVAADYGTGATFTIDEDIQVKSFVQVFQGKAVNDLLFTPILYISSIVDSTYESYKSADITTDLTLRAIEVSSTDDYNLEKDGHYYISDTVDWDEDNGYVLTRRIEERIIDSSYVIPDANVSTSGNTMTLPSAQAPANKYVSKLGGINNSFVLGGSTVGYANLAAAESALQNGEFGYRSNLYSFGASNYFKNTSMTSAADWNTWLASNSIKEYLVLYTPITISLTSEQAQSLLSMRTYDTATMITNTSDVPTEVVLEYGQSTTGTNALTGHNQAYIDQELEGLYGVKNLIPYPYQETSKTLYGVTFIDNGDGSVTVSTVAGGASAAAQFVMQTRASDKIHLKAGKYKLSGCPSGGNGVDYVLQAGNTDISPSVSVVDRGDGADIQMTQDASLGVWINIAKDTVITSPITFKPMLRLASIQSDEYQPYAKTNKQLTDDTLLLDANKVDWESNGVLGAKNLIPYPYHRESGYSSNGMTATYDEDGVITINKVAGSSTAYFALFSNTLFPNVEKFLLPNTEYILSLDLENALNTSIYASSSSGVDMVAIRNKTSGHYEERFTTPSEIPSLTVSLYYGKDTVETNCKVKAMIRIASDTDSTYQPYAMTNKELTDHKNGGATYVCTCNGQGANQIKAVTVSSDQKFSLHIGAVIAVTFNENNSYAATSENPIKFNVNNSGAIQIYYSTAPYTATAGTVIGAANYYVYYIYDGTYWVWLGYSRELDTTYTPQALGIGYGTCTTAAATAAKVVTLSGYALVTNGVIAVKFTYDVPASATLNVNSRGAKAIYYRGAAITAGIINAGDTATFFYNGSQYHVIAVDNVEKPTFTEASTRANIASGETLPTLFGKIKKWFSDIPNMFVSKSDGGTFNGSVTIDRQDGTTSNVGYSNLVLGNNKASGTDKNSRGFLEIFSNLAYLTRIRSTSTATRVIDLPDKDGTISLTSDIPTDFVSKADGGTFGGNVNVDEANGTSSSVGQSIVRIGNSTPQGTAGNSKGTLYLFGAGGYRANISATNIDSSHKDFEFPNKSGTIALTSDIPTVNNATLTIQRNGTTVKTFTANASSNVTADIAVPNGAVYYGTCNSQAANQKKAVTVAAAQNFSLATGAVLYVKFDADNTYSATAEAPVQLNVNSGTNVTVYGANTAAVTGTNTTYFGRKNYINCYMYDGTYWVWQGSSADNNSDTKVTQTVTTTNANYEVLFSQTADNTTRTEAARKNNNLLFNPSTGNLQATQLNGVAIGSSPKFTDTWTAMVGATSSANGSVGYVNAVPPKDGYNTKYLRADGTWTVPPNDNTDTNVTQTATSTNANYEVLFSATADNTTRTEAARKDSGLIFNPSTDTLSTKYINHKVLKALTGSGTAGATSTTTPKFTPALWTFNAGITVANGEVYLIKIPVAGGSYGVWLSLNNGTNYYPVAVSNGKARFQTNYAKDTVIAVSYESAGVCTCYARTGADATADVTGIFRVLNDYDANTTYSNMSATELSTGTLTTGRLISAKVLTDWLTGKGYITSSGSITGSSGSCTGNAATATNADKVDGSHAWNMQTLDANGNTHGASAYTLKCQHNLDGDGYFKFQVGDGTNKTKVDLSTSISLPRVSESCNNLPSTGITRIREYSSGSNYNLPTNDFYHILESGSPDSAWGTQLALGMTNESVHYRRYASSSWQPWKKLAFTSNTLIAKMAGTSSAGSVIVEHPDTGSDSDRRQILAYGNGNGAPWFMTIQYAHTYVRAIVSCQDRDRGVKFIDATHFAITSGPWDGVTIYSQYEDITISTASENKGVDVTYTRYPCASDVSAISNYDNGGNNVATCPVLIQGTSSAKRPAIGFYQNGGAYSCIFYMGADGSLYARWNDGTERRIIGHSDGISYATNDESGNNIKASYASSLELTAYGSLSFNYVLKNKNGTALSNGSVTLNTSSRRFKENIAPLTEEEAKKILDVEAVTFDYTKDYDNYTSRKGYKNIGCIAEDVNEIIPELVTEDQDGEIFGINYMEMVPYLLKVVQMQQTQIDGLKDELSSLRKSLLNSEE